MSTLRFDGSAHTIQLTGAAGDITGPFTAYNNVDSHSNGPWPDGTFSFIGYNTHAALSDPDSEYGAHGILIFNVPNRTGMGVHSGRAGIPDGLGRSGPQHCTLGCIRTTDEAMAAFLQVIAGDPMQSIDVDTPAPSESARLSGLLPSKKKKTVKKKRIARKGGKRTSRKARKP